MMDIGEIEELPSLKCDKCNSYDVVILTEATHTSTSVFMGKNKYYAFNSDRSWSTKDETEMIFCNDCQTSKIPDKPIHWEWIS